LEDLPFSSSSVSIGPKTLIIGVCLPFVVVPRQQFIVLLGRPFVEYKFAQIIFGVFVKVICMVPMHYVVHDSRNLNIYIVIFRTINHLALILFLPLCLISFILDNHRRPNDFGFGIGSPLFFGGILRLCENECNCKNCKFRNRLVSQVSRPGTVVL
jgi:hypothetical protein